MKAPPRAVLFDLDGTLVDSAPDLAGAANDMRVARGLSPLESGRFRPMVSQGARGMLGVAFDVQTDHADYIALRDEFLAVYEQRLLRETRVFEDMAPVLEAIEAAGLPWGIVTNKAERFTFPLVRGLGLARRAAVVIGGDTTAQSKPHPAPLLEASRRLALPPQACVYVGDDLRDVQAGRSAGMPTIVAAWGYLGDGAPIETWGADLVIESPRQLLKFVGLH